MALIRHTFTVWKRPIFWCQILVLCSLFRLCWSFRWIYIEWQSAEWLFGCIRVVRISGEAYFWLLICLNLKGAENPRNLTVRIHGAQPRCEPITLKIQPRSYRVPLRKHIRYCSPALSYADLFLSCASYLQWLSIFLERTLRSCCSP
jgi:hypothetical protein